MMENSVIINRHAHFERASEQVLAMGLRQMRQANEDLRLENIRLRHDIELCMKRMEGLAEEVEQLKSAN